MVLRRANAVIVLHVIIIKYLFSLVNTCVVGRDNNTAVRCSVLGRSIGGGHFSFDFVLCLRKSRTVED